MARTIWVRGKVFVNVSLPDTIQGGVVSVQPIKEPPQDGQMGTNVISGALGKPVLRGLRSDPPDNMPPRVRQQYMTIRAGMLSEENVYPFQRAPHIAMISGQHAARDE